MYTFKDEVVLITGASSGIGRETALKFGKLHAKIIVHYHSNEKAAKDIVSKLESNQIQAIAIQADLTKRDEVQQLLTKSISHFGKLDILINNAGSMVQRVAFENVTDEIWNNVYDINVKSMFYVTQEALPYLKESPNAAIVNVASVAARNGGGPGSIHYASAKGAVLTLTKGLAKELIPYNIRVNGVNPGVIETPFHEKFSSEEILNQLTKTIPIGRAGTPSEIANIIAYLASKETSYLYGEVIEINGGQLLD